MTTCAGSRTLPQPTYPPQFTADAKRQEMCRPQRMLAVVLAVVAACAAVLSCASGQDPNGENAAGSRGDATAESSDTLPALAMSASVAAKATTLAPDTIPESTASSPEVTSAAWSTLVDRSTYWLTTTGLEGPADLQVWNERVELACDASIWKPGSAEKVAAAFVHDDAGDAGDADLVESASWALWIITNHDTGCPDRFPRVATHPSTWIHLTGLFGPLDVATWRERIEPFCGIPTRDAVAAHHKELAESIASEYITEDGGDPQKPGLLSSAADILWIMSRTPGTCPEDSEAVAGHDGDR